MGMVLPSANMVFRLWNRFLRSISNKLNNKNMFNLFCDKLCYEASQNNKQKCYILHAEGFICR